MADVTQRWSENAPEDKKVWETVEALVTEINLKDDRLDNIEVGLPALDSSVVVSEGNVIADNTAYDLFTVPVAVGAGVALAVDVAVFMSDGTDFQVITLPVHVKAVNKAGTITAVVTELIGDLVAASAGTLTLAVAAAEGAANVLDVSITAVGSLTETVLLCSWSARVLYGGVAITAVNAAA